MYLIDSVVERALGRVSGVSGFYYCILSLCVLGLNPEFYTYYARTLPLKYNPSYICFFKETMSPSFPPFKHESFIHKIKVQ